MAYVVSLSSHGPIWTKLPEPSGPYPYGSPSAINNSGDIAGQSPAIGNSHAAVWLPKGGRYVLDRSWLPLSNLSFMNGIDNSGDVVGTDNGTFTHQVRKPLLWLGLVHQPLDLGCSKYTAGISPPLREKHPGRGARGGARPHIHLRCWNNLHKHIQRRPASRLVELVDCRIPIE
jgi:hypothetical protein